MDSDNQLVVYCEDDGEYRIYCDICDNLYIGRFCKDHLKSQTHLKIIRKRHQINESFGIISQY